jgi:hypothetical protein
VADVEKILQLVAQGVLTAEEADEILSATAAAEAVDSQSDTPVALAESAPGEGATGARHLRIEVSEGGRRVVNLRVPLNVAGWASGFLPGLSDEYADRIRSAIASRERGPILDINSDDGSRVLIVSE